MSSRKRDFYSNVGFCHGLSLAGFFDGLSFAVPTLRFGRSGSTRRGVFFFGVILREALDPPNGLVNSLVRFFGIIWVHHQSFTMPDLVHGIFNVFVPRAVNI